MKLLALRFQSALAVGLTVLVALGYPNLATAQTPPPAPAEKPAGPEMRDGQHDFDFALGTWKTHISVMQHPLSGSTSWTQIEGTAVIRKVWDGRADLEEIEGDSATGHFEGMTLRLYNPQAHQWNLYWANGKDGTLATAMVGEFKDGRGVFYDQETNNGRAILSRNIYFDITPTSYRFEQAYSDDGGQTWETNFTAALTREEPDANEAAIQAMGTTSDMAHDFDWQFGDWTVQMSRLEHPLTGSKKWTPIDGTVRVRKIWNGRANLAEIEVSGPLGHLEFLSLRLYNPQTREWSLIFANANKGVVGEQMYGTFKGGRGVFYAQETSNGKRIFVRFVFSDATATSAKDEQAYSDDGGKTWEVNWKNVHTLQKRP
jgi:hypothetical protein